MKSFVVSGLFFSTGFSVGFYAGIFLWNLCDNKIYADSVIW